MYMFPCIGRIMCSVFFFIQCRELFLSNRGVEQLVSLTQPMNKIIVALATDIFLQLSVESGKEDLCSWSIFTGIIV